MTANAIVANGVAGTFLVVLYSEFQQHKVGLLPSSTEPKAVGHFQIIAAFSVGSTECLERCTSTPASFQFLWQYSPDGAVGTDHERAARIDYFPCTLAVRAEACFRPRQGSVRNIAFRGWLRQNKAMSASVRGRDTDASNSADSSAILMISVITDMWSVTGMPFVAFSGEQVGRRFQSVWEPGARKKPIDARRGVACGRLCLDRMIVWRERRAFDVAIHDSGDA